ncbi:hypothetical protein ABDB91_15580 [Desulfoscipio sp. XC116]|uniref:hypothetical protein n=1 Tax=Desulfoscipio sp. XC116 TaxID=3144975 RepID=UPI00325AD010
MGKTVLMAFAVYAGAFDFSGAIGYGGNSDWDFQGGRRFVFKVDNGPGGGR